MGNNNNKKKYQNPPNMLKCEDYDLKQSFSKLSRYHSTNGAQTDLNNTQEQGNTPINSIIDNDFVASPTNPLTSTYFRLEDKISDLSNKNDKAHDDLRKELEGKIDKAKTDVAEQIKNVETQIKDKKDNWKWIVGIAATIIIPLLGYIVYPYQKTNDNQQKITDVQTTIEKSIMPAIDRINKDVEKNSSEINNNREKIYHIQLEQQNLNSIIRTLDSNKSNK